MGIDGLTGQARMSFGVPQLLDGIEVTTLAVAMFAVGEALYVAATFHQEGTGILAIKALAKRPLRKDEPKRWPKCWYAPIDTVPEARAALAFTLSRRSPHYTGTLPMEQYRRIFAQAQGRYGSTQDYALDTYEGLRAVGIHDRALRRLIESAQDSQGDTPTAQSGA